MLTLAIWAVRLFYLISSLAIITVRLIPAFADRFLAYGARARPERRAHTHGNKESAEQNLPLVGIQLLDDLATYTVPHSWFTHFYILSLACSSASLSTFYYYDHYHEDIIKQHPDLEVAAFCAHLILMQGLRRLLECIFVTQNSASPEKNMSRMWIGHYAIGVAFYLVTNVAIWIEQLCQPPAIIPATGKRSILWSWRTIFFSLIFFAASIKQNRYHRYLSSLKKYTVPEKHAFRYIIAPHYTMECLIYLSVAGLDAPAIFDHHSQRSTPTTINWTLLCALIFVVVNLGVTADGTKEWQRHKFRDEDLKIAKRWRMIPWVY